MGVFAKALGWYDELVKQGRISGYRVYASAVRDSGMLVAEGDAAELARITAEPESTTLVALSANVVEDIQTEVYLGGSPDDVVGHYSRVIEAAKEAGLT
jgi:hypothetical protein